MTERPPLLEDQRQIGLRPVRWWRIEEIAGFEPIHLVEVSGVVVARQDRLPVRTVLGPGAELAVERVEQFGDDFADAGASGVLGEFAVPHDRSCRSHGRQSGDPPPKFVRRDRRGGFGREVAFQLETVAHQVVQGAAEIHGPFHIAAVLPADRVNGQVR
ncbi:hypothetical protein [Nocardia rhamnosiphila]|uniref:hypothetical protein n=1 Tax=Nocardia rhamnosiphila TaxID=426716 RepID=UPI0009DFBFC0